MIKDLIVAPHLWANIDNVDETSRFIKVVLYEYLKKISIKNLQDIDGVALSKDSSLLIQKAIEKVNPDFALNVITTIRWECIGSKFYAQVFVGIKDFDMPRYGVNAIPSPTYYQ